MTTARDVIRQALLFAQAIDPNEEISPVEFQDGLALLNAMLDHWSVQQIQVPVVTRESFALTIGKHDYSIGPAGFLATDRPIEILDAYITDSGGSDQQLREMSRKDYGRLTTKGTNGRPRRYFFDLGVSDRNIFLDHAPGEAMTLHLASIKPMANASNITDTVEFGPGADMALFTNLAVWMAPQYGVAPPMLEKRARQALSSFSVANKKLEPLRSSIRGSKRRGGGSFADGYGQ